MNALVELKTLLPQNLETEAFDIVAQGSDYFPRIQLMSSQSGLVAEDKIQKGHFAYVTKKDSFRDLGPTFDCVVLAVLPKTMLINDDTIESSYNHKDPNFLKILSLAKQGSNNGALYGPEFLIWVPDVGYGTWHLNNATGRIAANEIKNFMHKAITVASRLIVTKKYKWFGPEIVECLSFDQSSLPPTDELQKRIEKFLSFVNTAPANEVVEETDDRAR